MIFFIIQCVLTGRIFRCKNFKVSFQVKNGDCYELIKKIPHNSIDLILTDPPYNVSPCSTGNIKIKGRKDFKTDIAEWDHKPLNVSGLATQFQRILKPKGNIFIFTNYNLIGQFHKFFNPIFDTFNLFVWHKTNPSPQVRKKSFLSSCELIVCCWNKGHTFNFTTQNQMHNFFQGPICQGHERTSHPTQKPLKLLKHLIKIGSFKYETVFDPFMGSGSTGHASIELERDFIGFEIEKNYFQIAEKRLKDTHVLCEQNRQEDFLERIENNEI